jgi:hypothetical protein
MVDENDGITTLLNQCSVIEGVEAIETLLVFIKYPFIT